MTMTKRRVVWALATAVSLACVLWPLGASAQTYVRPSKGAAFNPFATNPNTVSLPTAAQGCNDNKCCDNASTNKDNSWPVIPNVVAVGQTNQWCSAAYDWTAFAGAQVTLYSTASTNNANGYRCSSVTPTQYTFTGLGNYVRFKIDSWNNNGYNSVKSHSLSVLSYTSPGSISTGYSLVDPLSSGSDFIVPGNYARQDVFAWFSSTTLVGCPIEMRVTPLPFTEPQSVRVTNSSTTPASVTVTNTTGYSVNIANQDGLACDALGTTSSKVTGTVSINPLLPYGANYAFVHIADAGAGQPYYGYARVCSVLTNFMVARCASDFTGSVADYTSYTKPGEYLMPGECANFDKRASVTCTSQDPNGATFSLFSCNY